MGSSPLLESINVGTPREIRYRGRRVMTSIWKYPVEGVVAVRGVNLAGDDQADRRVHGGPDKAVYVYAREDLDWWQEELGMPLASGTFGENLTTRGVDVTNAVVGERWRIGTATLEVAQPRLPCFKLGVRMGTQRFPKRFTQAERPGAYLRIIEEGELAAEQPVAVMHRPEHGVTVSLMARARQIDQSLAPRLLDAPELPHHWREWAEGLCSLGKVEIAFFSGHTICSFLQWAYHRARREETMAKLSEKKRDKLPRESFAFPKERKEPLNDAEHVRNAVARFDQVKGVTNEERDRAWARIRRAAKKYGVHIEERGWRALFRKNGRRVPS